MRRPWPWIAMALLAACINGDEAMSRHVLHHVTALEALISLAEADRGSGVTEEGSRSRLMRGSPVSMRKSRQGPDSPSARPAAAAGRTPTSQAKTRRPQAAALPPISVSAQPSLASVSSAGGRSFASLPSLTAMPVSSKSIASDILAMLGPFNWIECENCHNREMCGRYCQICGHRTPAAAL